jgi:hypothetical protein
MICPIKDLGHLINTDNNRLYDRKCNPECAWWDIVRKQCCLASLIDAHPWL